MTKPTFGYTDTPHERDQRRQERRASAYVPNVLYDKLLELRDRDPAGYAAVTTPTLRIAIGYYENDKAAFEKKENAS